jgi:tetratricopeptide (TPR) repeat protein
MPVIGIVQIGAQSMADRYTYLPQLGALIALAFGLWKLMRERLTQMILLVLALACGLFMQTQHQVQFWRDSRTLFEHALAATGDNWVMRNNLGAMAMEAGDLHAAATHFTEAVRIAPENAELHGSLGEALARLGQFRPAIEHFDRAIALDPNYHGAMNNLAWLLATLPPPFRDERRAILLAEQVCREANRAGPSYASYLDTLAATYSSVGRMSDAIKVAEEARDLAARTNQPQLAADIESRVAGYRQGVPAQ